MSKFSMGKHLLLEVYDVNFDLLNDISALQKCLTFGIQKANMNILNTFAFSFPIQGCTIVFALSESHVSCHTWPEEGCTSIDVYTCGESNPHLIISEVLQYLNSKTYSLRELNR